MAYKSQYMKPSNRQPIQLGSVLMRVALVLLCLVMLSFHLMGSLFARYSTSGTGSDGARVAKFAVEVDGSEDVTVDALTSSDGTYTITVHNNSEVAVKYNVTVTCSKVVEGVTAMLDSEEGTLSGQDWQFSDVGTLAPNATSELAHVLNFLVDWAIFTEDATGPAASDSFTFTVTIHVVQVD